MHLCGSGSQETYGVSFHAAPPCTPALRFVSAILHPAPRIRSRRLLRPAPELEVRLLERALHRVGRHLLEEKMRQHDLGDARRGLPLAGGQLGIEVGEFGAKAGFPHECNLAARLRRNLFRVSRI